MVLVNLKRLLSRFVPLFCALLILICCVPALPASAAQQVYNVYLDGSRVISAPIAADSIVLHLVLRGDYYRIYFDGYEEDYFDSGYYQEFSYQKFAGFSTTGQEDHLSYANGTYTAPAEYQITLTADSPSLSLTSVFYYPLYVYPNGGFWKSSQEDRVFWDLANTDTEGIEDPERVGYLFAGWSFSGEGEFNDVGDPPYIYEHGYGPGYLTANWVDDPDTFKTVIYLNDLCYPFATRDSSPPVSVSVTESGCVFSDGNTEYSWIFSGDGDFLGLAYEQDAAVPLIPVGSSADFPGSDQADSTYYLFPVFSGSGGTSGSGSGTVLKAGQWECNSLIMTGEFLDLSEWPPEIALESFEFRSNGQDFASMIYRYDAYRGYYITYDSHYAYNYDLLSPSPSPYWYDENFAQIYLEEAQEVSPKFYAWFTSNFHFVSHSESTGAYSTTVNIYDAFGVNLLHTIKFSGDVAPVVSLIVNQTGCSLTFQDQTSSWSAGDSPFYGFALSSGASGPYYKPGFSYSLPGGGPSDVTINLYVSESESSTGEVSNVISGFVATLINPVMAFFNVEFIPGFSFGKIALVVFVIGLVFWFLRMSK